MTIVPSFAEVGARVREFRVARGFDQRRLGEACGLGRTVVSKIETGDRNVSALELTRIAAALSVTVPDLMYLPPEPVLAARTGVATGPASLDAEVLLDRLLRDADQLAEMGVLPQAREIGSHTVSSIEDARDLAARARAALGVRDEPLAGLAEVCAEFGLWLEPVHVEVDAMSASPSLVHGVAVVGLHLDPGRRRSSAAHELGHHLSGDSYSADVDLSVTHQDREALIDAFAAEFLLPRRVCSAALSGADGSERRRRAVRLGVQYRTSWAVVVKVARDVGLSVAEAARRPTDHELLEACGRRPEPDLQPNTMAPAWVRACMAALRQGSITPRRAAEIARAGLRAEDISGE